MLSPLPTTVLNANTKLRTKLIKPCTDILTTQRLSINCNFFHQLIFILYLFPFPRVCCQKINDREGKTENCPVISENHNIKKKYTKPQKIFRTWCQYPRCPISINLTGQSVCLPLEQFQKLSCPAMTEVGCKRYFSVKLRIYSLSTCWWRRRWSRARACPPPGWAPPPPGRWGGPPPPSCPPPRGDSDHDNDMTWRWSDISTILGISNQVAGYVMRLVWF